MSLLLTFQSFLSNTLFYILLVNFALICVLFLLNTKRMASEFKNIRIHAWIAFIVILLLGSYLRFDSPGCSSHDGLCWDYVKTSVNMLENQKVEDFWHPKGYSLLIALGFLLFGQNYNTILYLNLILSSLTIFIVFLLAYVLFEREDVALFSSFIYSLFPMSILYAKLNASEVTSVFFILLTFLLFFISIRAGRRSLYLLFLLLLVFSLHVRSDNSLFIPVFIVGLLLYRKRIDMKKVRVPLLIFLIFMIPVSYYYIVGDDIYGPARDPHYEERPVTFSLSYLIPNIQYHLSSNLADPASYPPVLYVFLLLSLFFIPRERNLIFPVLWVVFFFLFYGLYWATIYTSPQLYQLSLQPVLAILMGYGIFKAKETIENLIEKSSAKILHSAKTTGVFLVLFLIFFIFYSGTNVFAPQGHDCLIDNIFLLGTHVGEDECLLIENSQSNFCMCQPGMVMRILLPGKRITTSLQNCEGRGTYYLYINHTMCDTTFFGYDTPIFSQLREDHKLEMVEERGCATLYKIGE